MIRSRKNTKNILDQDLQIREILIVLRKERFLTIFLNLLDLQKQKINVDFRKEALTKKPFIKILKKLAQEKNKVIIRFIQMMKAPPILKFL
jgi:hypothetical protein